MRLSIVVALASLLTSGCLATSHSPGDPVPLEAFCEAFFDALCGPIETCGCSEAAAESCRSEQRELCRGFPSDALVAAVAEDRVLYDPVAASVLTQRLRSRGCEGFVESLEWQVRDLFDLGGTFHGTRGAGEPCEVLGFELISECELGSCASVAGGAICRTSVGGGERCDRTHQCVDLEGTLTSATGIGGLVLRCVEDSPGAESGVCSRYLTEGEPCETDAACWNGRCVDMRCEARPLGAECVTSRDCATGLYCRERACAVAGAPDGRSCESDAACASQFCIADVCEASWCGAF